MKKLIILFLMLVLSSSIAHASIFDWVIGMFAINQEEKPPTEEPLPTTPTTVYEQVTCKFLGSTSTQTCYAPNIDQSCTGTDSCTMTIMGAQGSQFYIKACGGAAYATIDSADETVEFKCEQPLEKASEQVECVFTNANTIQRCYSVPGAYSCEGLGSCMIQISGYKRITSFTWRSGCSGESYAVIDGTNKRFEFKCETSENVEQVSEQVKCVFEGATQDQKCYTTEGTWFSCGGADYSCYATVKGSRGKQLAWTSSCGGSAYTTLDSVDETIVFNCTTIKPQLPQPVVEKPITEEVKEEVKCVFRGTTSQQKCYADNGQFCGGPDACATTILGQKGRQVIWKSSCGGYASTIMDGNNEVVEFNCEQTAITPVFEPIKETVVCVFTKYRGEQTCMTDDKKFSCSAVEGKCPVNVYSSSGVYGSRLAWYSTCGGKAITILDRVDETITFDCGQAPETPAVPVENVKEQVKCVFLESKQLQSCYSEFGQTCEGETSCVMDIIGEKGRKTALKSSCGGYAYILIDGNNENAEFKCLPREEVAPEQIVGRGFNRAAWECYDGTSAVSQDVGCLPSEVWNKKAELYCEGHCYQDGSKCGVNSFSVSEECYEAIPQVQPVELEKVKEEMNKKLEKDALAYVYAKNCQYCEGMEEEVDKAAKELNIQVSKIDRDQGASSMGIVPYSFVYGNAVPLLLFAKGEKEGGFKIYTRPGKTDAQTIIQWVNDIYTGNVKPQEPVDLEKLKEEMEESKEETLFCKDSCPLDGKCYPFGYRKGGNFCFDEGIFVPQLGDDQPCENNFECSTNVCVDGKCVSSGLIQKIINWFTKLFG